tara:strand:+ start:8889 stop:10451 length:1563 start_codon:yes stop_codon:yes gene_type:complete
MPLVARAGGFCSSASDIFEYLLNSHHCTMKFDIASLGAELTPDRQAIWFQGRWYSYRDINERANRLANHLASVGIGFGSRIGFLASNHLAYFDLLLAAPKLGFILIPYSLRMSVEQLRKAAQATSPQLVLSDARHTEQARRAFECPLASMDDVRVWLANASRMALVAPQLSPESGHLIHFTAGTAHEPKAVLMPYRQTISNAQATAMEWDIGPEDCVVQGTDCWHASVNVLSVPLLSIGGRVILMSAFDPHEYLDLMQRYGATLMALYPAMYESVIQHPDFATADLGQVRWAVSGGANCGPRQSGPLAARGIPLIQAYGLTEAGPNCFAVSLDELQANPGTVGRPMSHLQAEIRRPDGSACPDNEPGELTLAGEAICSGYFDSSESWQQSLRDGWLWTGDIARRDENGLFYILGRSSEVFSCGGALMFPDEIERGISSCDEVAECAVIGITDSPSDRNGAALAAIVLRPGVKQDANLIRASLRRYLEPHKVPQVMMFVDSLPRNDVGQVDRNQLRQTLLS